MKIKHYLYNAFIIEEGDKRNPSVPCTWQPLSECKDCPTKDSLMCRFDSKDMVSFLMTILPFGITAIAGTIRAGYGWYLLLWLAYSIFFSLCGKLAFCVVIVPIGQRRDMFCTVTLTTESSRFGNTDLGR